MSETLINSASNDSSLSFEELLARLHEAEETLEAIRTGQVDAVVIAGPAGQQVYTLENADRPYRVLVEQMHEGAVTLSGDGTILYCNERFAKLVGVAHDSIAGQPIGVFFNDNESRTLSGMVKSASENGVAGEFTLIDRGGTDVPVNISLIDLRVDEGSPRLLCGIVTDLTVNRMRTRELGAANERLAKEIVERRKTEESLQLTLEAAEMGIWELDLATGKIGSSPRQSRILGHAIHQPRIALASLIEHFLPDSRAKVAEAFELAETTGSVDFEHRIRRMNDGAVRWVNVKGRAYFEDSKPIRIAGVMADINQRRQVDEQLRQAQKMEAVGQLTGGIAHDFNNLLMIIGGSLDMLGRRMGDEPKVRALFEAARLAVGRGAKLNQQLLAFSRRQDLHIEAVQINDLITTFENLLDRAMGETITMEFVRDADLWPCKTDPHQLETAILNLAINARDAMPQGGTLTVRTANRVVDDAFASRWEAPAGEYAMISVEDTGTGMSPEVIAHVFEPFFTTKDVGKGTGLGLSQVYGFAKQSGGFVAVKSHPGRGTTIEVFLKRSSEAPSVTRPLAEESLESGTGVVLVVEDDAAVRITTSGMLEDLGYSVVPAETGSAALKIIQSNASIDLVLSDVVMPEGMSGVELAKRIGTLRPDLPVLLTSGYTAQRVIPETSSGELALLKKPFSQTDLSVAIRNVVAAPAGQPSQQSRPGARGNSP
jgi:PAS domain S-box-containing protein